MTVALRVAEFTAGLVVVVGVLDSAIRTFILPRGSGVLISRLVSRAVRMVFDLVARAARTWEGQDRAMALYGPITLLAFPVAWLIGTLGGFTLMYHATTSLSWRMSVRMSGSSLLTLGFAVPVTGTEVALVFTEAAIGLTLIALLIAYLPTMYSGFSRREVAVTQLSVMAGTPPSATDLLIRAHAAHYLDRLEDAWTTWELWFVELEETHTSLAMLNFFRSPNPHRSWLTASGTVLDAAALRLSVLDLPYSPAAAVCIRSGFTALRSIADFFQIPYDPDPAPDAPISITREEFIDAYEQLAAAGCAVRPDRELAWRDYRGWRVNYDTVLVTLAGLIMAPYASWISDRSITRRRHRPPVRGPKSRNAR